MPFPALTTQDYLERKFTAATVQQFAMDGADPSTVAGNVADAIGEASDRVYAIYRPFGKTVEQVAAMFNNPTDPDRYLLGLVGKLTMGILGQRKAGLMGPEAMTIYGAMEREAAKLLAAAAKGEEAPAGETNPGAGENTFRFGVEPNRTAEAALYFGGTRDNPRGPGGF